MIKELVWFMIYLEEYGCGIYRSMLGRVIVGVNGYLYYYGWRIYIYDWCEFIEVWVEGVNCRSVGKRLFICVLLIFVKLNFRRKFLIV